MNAPTAITHYPDAAVSQAVESRTLCVLVDNEHATFSFWADPTGPAVDLDSLANAYRRRLPHVRVFRRGEFPAQWRTEQNPRFGDLTFLRTAASITFDALGLGVIARQIEQAGVAGAVDQLSLDGMLALWRPAGSN